LIFNYITASLNTRPRCSKLSNISKLAQAGDSSAASQLVLLASLMVVPIILVFYNHQSSLNLNILHATISRRLSATTGMRGYRYIQADGFFEAKTLRQA
jgi:hypothetical protein